MERREERGERREGCLRGKFLFRIRSFVRSPPSSNFTARALEASLSALSLAVESDERTFPPSSFRPPSERERERGSEGASYIMA